MTDEEAAKAYASGTVFVDETGNDEALIYNMRAMAFLAGVEHGRKDSEKRERAAFEAAQRGRWGMFIWDGVATDTQCFSFEYANIDDWKKEQEGK